MSDKPNRIDWKREASNLHSKLQAAEEAHKLMVTDLNIYAEREQRLRAENDRLREALEKCENLYPAEGSDCFAIARAALEVKP